MTLLKVLSKLETLNKHFNLVKAFEQNMENLTLELQWTCCCPPINEKTLTCPSQDELAITAGFLGHHATSKLH